MTPKHSVPFLLFLLLGICLPVLPAHAYWEAVRLQPAVSAAEALEIATEALLQQFRKEGRDEAFIASFQPLRIQYATSEHSAKSQGTGYGAQEGCWLVTFCNLPNIGYEYYIRVERDGTGVFTRKMMR